MIADVVEYTAKKGCEWQSWPWPASCKPSNVQLLVAHKKPREWLWMSHPNGARVQFRVHALRLSNGREWDSINGFRDGGGPA